MTHHDDDPQAPSFEFSQTELESIHLSLAQTLIKKGVPEMHAREIPARDGGPTPYQFNMPISGKVAKTLFYPTDQGLYATEASSAVYVSPVRLNDEPGAPIIECSSVEIVTLLAGTDITRHETFGIIKKNATYTAEVSTVYNQGGQMISPNALAYDENAELTDERIAEMVSDRVATDRELTQEDAEKLRHLLDILDA